MSMALSFFFLSSIWMLLVIGSVVLPRTRRGDRLVKGLRAKIPKPTWMQAGLFSLVHSLLTFAAMFGSYGVLHIGAGGDDHGFGTLFVAIPFFLTVSWIVCFSLGRRLFGFPLGLSAILFVLGGLGVYLFGGLVGWVYGVVFPSYMQVREWCLGFADASPFAAVLLRRLCLAFLDCHYEIFATTVLMPLPAWAGIVVKGVSARWREKLVVCVAAACTIAAPKSVGAYPVSEADPDTAVHQLLLTIESATLLNWTTGNGYPELGGKTSVPGIDM